ncbi:MAG TPA: hypothetical protein PKW82_05780 [Spirochaetales bacterium]|nr:hypothetical protein [Spirochaetales bacterium]
MTARKKFAAAALAALVSLSLAACSGGASSEPPPIPADALGWIRIDDARATLEGLDAFWKSAGIEKATGMSLAETFTRSSGIEPDRTRDAMKEIDAARPVVAAVLPSAGAEPAVVLYLPLRNGSASMGVLSDYFGAEDQDYPPVQVGSWLVFGIDAPAPAEAPAATLTLPVAARSGGGAIIATGLVAPILDAYAEEVSAAVSGMAEAVESAGALPYDMGELAPALLDAMAQFERVELGIEFGKDGVDLDFGLVPVEGSLAADYGRRLSEGADGMRHLDRIPADALYAGAWSVNPEALAEFNTAYASIMGVEELFGEAYADYIDAWIEAQGANGAMSFDMAIAPDLFARIASLQDPQAIFNLLDQAIGVDIRVVQDAADGAAWFRLVEALADDELFGAEFDELFEASGVGFDIRHGSEGSGEGRFDTIGFEFFFGPALSAGLDPSTFALTQALMSRMLGKFELGFAVRDGLALMSTNGRVGIDALAEGSASLPASKDPGWRRFLASPSAERIGVLKLSTRSLARIFASMDDLIGIQVDPERFDGWFFAVYADASHLGLEFSLPASDFDAAVDLYLQASAAGLGI